MVNKKSIFTEYHHTSYGMNRYGKPKGQAGIEECIKHYSNLSLRDKYFTMKYINRAIADKDIFTEKELKNYLASLRRQKIISEEQAKDIFDLSKGILPKHEEISQAPELNEAKPKMQIKTPRYEKLIQEMRDRAAIRMEAYKNRNKPGRPSGKSDEDTDNSDELSRGESFENGIKSDRRNKNKSVDDNKPDEVLVDKFDGKPKLGRLPQRNIPLSRFGNN